MSEVPQSECEGEIGMKKFFDYLYYLLWAAVSIAFILLKAFGAVTYSWIWALAPLWVPIVIVLIGSVIFAGIAALQAYRKK